MAICDPRQKSQEFKKKVSINEIKNIFQSYSIRKSSKRKNKQCKDDCNNINTAFERKLLITESNHDASMSDESEDIDMIGDYERKMSILYKRYGDKCNHCGQTGHWSFECRRHPDHLELRETIFHYHRDANI